MTVDYQGQKRNFPDIIILGAAKCGTTSLAFYLKQHPDVYMPRKEPGFFAYSNRPAQEIPSGIRDRQMVNVDKYTAMYEGHGGRLICDSSVAHFTNHDQTIANIRAVYKNETPQLKTSLVLRNPVDRSFSHYLMFVKNGLEELSFEEAIRPEVVKSRIDRQLGYDYLGGSLYYERVKAFLEAFPQTKVYITEDLKKKKILLHDFLDYCGLRKDVNIDVETRLNPSGVPKNKGLIRILHHRNGAKAFLKKVLPDSIQFKLTAAKSKMIEKNIRRVDMNPLTRAKILEEVFLPDIEKLEGLINRDLSAWKVSEKEIQEGIS
ncbi:MAG: sulfotransferase [Flavobacteriales bacterium]|nr:sulfotransferase [Flavobacteriales bacterium]